MQLPASIPVKAAMVGLKLAIKPFNNSHYTYQGKIVWQNLMFMKVH